MTVAAAPVESYVGPSSTRDIATAIGIDPIEVVRFDGNFPSWPLGFARPAAIAGALSTINEYDHTRGAELIEAIASYCGVAPENIVLGSGGDDILSLCARAFLRPGDRVAIVPERTYPMYRIAAGWVGAEVDGNNPALTFVCRPNNPTGELTPLPSARPLVVDEAYAEFAGVSALDLIDEDVIVVRTFSKLFGLASARVGYAVAREDLADRLRERQHPYAISTLSAALALAGLRALPDPKPIVEERDRLAGSLAKIGLRPLVSHTNFLFVPTDEPGRLYDGLLARGLVVRTYEDGLRIGARDRHDDDLLVAVLTELTGQPAAHSVGLGQARLIRATAETSIRVRLNPWGSGLVHVATGVGFWDHMIEQLAFNAGFDLQMEGTGDLETGDHHTAEDSMRALGDALSRALGDRRGINRYGTTSLPMDDAAARATIDISGRAFCKISFRPAQPFAAHLFDSFVQAARVTLHVSSAGAEEHHITEAAFKAVGRALREGLARTGVDIASTKGQLV